LHHSENKYSVATRGDASSGPEAVFPQKAGGERPVSYYGHLTPEGFA